jgi:hypothetical protein
MVKKKFTIFFNGAHQTPKTARKFAQFCIVENEVLLGFRRWRRPSGSAVERERKRPRP